MGRQVLADVAAKETSTFRDYHALLVSLQEAIGSLGDRCLILWLH